MPPLRIKTKDITRLLDEGKIQREMQGDSETGRVYFELMKRRFYYHQARRNKEFFVREILY